MKRIAIVGVILEDPQGYQHQFNQLVAQYKGMIRGRMGLPFDYADMAVISLVIEGTLDEINSFTGKLGRVPSITVKTAISQKVIADHNVLAGG